MKDPTMKNLVKMLMASSLLIGVAPYGWANSKPQLTQAAKMERAKMEETRGDLARLHEDNYRAVAYYRMALRDDRHNAALFNKLGIAELQLNELRAARKYFGQALKYDPTLIPAMNNMGAAFLMDKKYKPALGYFKQALALDESVAATHVNLAEAWMGLGKIDYAMTEYSRALELDPDVLSAAQGGTLAQVSSPEERARISFLIAKAYIRRGNLDGALDYLGRAKALHYRDLDKVYSDPDFAPLWKDPRLVKVIKG